MYMLCPGAGSNQYVSLPGPRAGPMRMKCAPRTPLCLFPVRELLSTYKIHQSPAILQKRLLGTIFPEIPPLLMTRELAPSHILNLVWPQDLYCQSLRSVF